MGTSRGLHSPALRLVSHYPGVRRPGLHEGGLRLAIYLDRLVQAPCFFKVGRSSAHRIIHVAMLRTMTEWRTVRPYLKEAYRFAEAEDAARKRTRR